MPSTLTASGYGPTEKARHVLHVVWSPDRVLCGRTLPLTQELVLGREVGAGVRVIADPRMSRQHVRLKPSRGQAIWLAEDLGSKNRMHINGATADVRALEDGDALRVGDTTLVYECQVSDPGLEAAGADPERAAAFIGISAASQRIRGEVATAATGDVGVLIQGETGSGKEVVAGLLHRLSRRPGRFQAVNCGAIPAHLIESTLFGHRRGAFTGATDNHEGHFVAADRGTLFLDEVAELPLPAQAALLRVLEDGQVMAVGATRARSVDVRVVAATHAGLRDAVAEGRFRADLYTRLAGWTIVVPPLRRRRADVILLAQHFGGALDLAADAAEALVVAPWPGNVRELRSALGRAKTLAGAEGKIGLAQLPDEIATPIRSRATLPSTSPDEGDRPTKGELVSVLRWARGNVSKVAERYGRTRKQIYRWIEMYGLKLDDMREPGASD